LIDALLSFFRLAWNEHQTSGFQPPKDFGAEEENWHYRQQDNYERCLGMMFQLTPLGFPQILKVGEGTVSDLVGLAEEFRR
jgi:hypothetical protein